jgi:hypothetical protein
MIPVVWHEGIAGLYAHEGVHGRSRYACCGLLNSAFDSYGIFEHFSGFGSLPKNAKGAIFIVHGGHERHDVDIINQDASQLEWVFFIVIGDEDADFKESQLWHRNMKLWRQSPVPGVSKANRFPIVGYPCDIHEHLIQGQERILDWFFAGQVTHDRRTQCVAALRNIPNGRLLETKQFYSGMPHDEYFRTLGQTKIVPCPSGPVCSDTFRMAEALEAGCIPIVDEWPGWRDKPVCGFFQMLFSQGMPFPLIENWNQLPQVMESLLADYPRKAAEVQTWWAAYKADYYSWLGKDLKALGVSL